MIQAQSPRSLRSLKTPRINLSKLIASLRFIRGPQLSEQFWLTMLAGSDPETAALLYEQIDLAELQR